MQVTTRPAQPADATRMTVLLNEIIAIGGTTAHQRPFDEARMLHHYIQPDHHISTMVAELDGAIVGFQMLVWPNPDEGPMPDHWGFIGSFVKVGITGQGIGRALFTATCAAARAAGCLHIDATIRADNASGLRFYAAMGFTDYDVIRDVPLRDGRLVDRVRKRFDLN
jgi:ribosomal protein S18 acetylase RimI-like enzyme